MFLFTSLTLLKYIWINKLYIICSSFMSKWIYHPVNKSSIRYKYGRCYVWMARLFFFREDLLCPLRGRKRRMDGQVQSELGSFSNNCLVIFFCLVIFLSLVFFFSRLALSSYSKCKCRLLFLVYNTTECDFQLIKDFTIPTQILDNNLNFKNYSILLGSDGALF